jgi:hypothetical protein
MMSAKKISMQHDSTDFENEIVDVLIEKICLVYKHVRLKITFLFSYSMRQITKFETEKCILRICYTSRQQQTFWYYDKLNKK